MEWVPANQELCGIHRPFRGPKSKGNSGLLVVGAAAAGRGLRAERLVHDVADGARAAAALGAATEAAIDLPRRARTHLRRDGGADIVVTQDVAGTDDHGGPLMGTLICNPVEGGKGKPTFLQVI